MFQSNTPTTTSLPPRANSVLRFLHSQLFIHPPLPTHSFTHQTILITGANTGLGLETARHFVRLGAARVILGCRSLPKGLIALADIERTTHRLGVCEVWRIDMEDFESVKAFVKRAGEELERVDVLMANAGLTFMDEELHWSEKAGMETTVTVNVVGTFLLVLLMLPVLRGSERTFGIVPRICVTASSSHEWTSFPERNAPHIFEAMKEDNPVYLRERYMVSKLISLLCVRALGHQLRQPTHPPTKIIINTANPSACTSHLFRQGTGITAFIVSLLLFFLARTAEVGARTLVDAAVKGEESNGMYLNDCVVSRPGEWVESQEGKVMGEKVWEELLEVLGGIEGGVRDGI